MASFLTTTYSFATAVGGVFLILSCLFTHIEAPKVGFLFASKDLEGSGLADAIGAHKAKHLPRARRGQAVQFEGIGTVAVSCVLLQVTGQVDDIDGLKWAFLHTHHTCWCSQYQAGHTAHEIHFLKSATTRRV